MKGDATTHTTNAAYREGWARTFAQLVPYPADMPRRTNGGVECDMLYGPCACGAWHRRD